MNFFDPSCPCLVVGSEFFADNDPVRSTSRWRALYQDQFDCLRKQYADWFLVVLLVVDASLHTAMMPEQFSLEHGFVFGGHVQTIEVGAVACTL